MLKSTDELNSSTNAKMTQIKMLAHLQIEALKEDSFWNMYFLTLKGINESTIHSLTNSLLDTQNQDFTAEYIDFFEETSLEEIEFEDLNSNPFYIQNKATKKRLAFSNRYTTNEIRGTRLRKLIEDNRQTEPTLTLNNLLMRAIKEPTVSDTHRYFISSPFCESLDERTKVILIKTSRLALLMLAGGELLVENSLITLFDQQYNYFHDCPESIKSLQTQVLTTTAILEKALKEALEKKSHLPNGDNQLDEIIGQLRAAIHTGYDLMPDFNQDGTYSFPANSINRVNTYTEAAATVSNNPKLKQLSISSYIGISLFVLGFMAIATCAAAIFFPPAAFFLSQVLLHGIVSTLVIEGTLAGVGAVAASAGIGFFSKGKKFQGCDKMNALKQTLEKSEPAIPEAAC